LSFGDYSGGDFWVLVRPKYLVLFSHTNRTPKSKSTADEADAAFKPVPRREQPEFNARLYRENEEREWEQKIAALRQIRLQHEAANPPSQRNKLLWARCVCWVFAGDAVGILPTQRRGLI
jgi:hypothetical protein